jgi:tRNA(Ile2) C34 agmatinyltransferase TiaS
MAPSMISAAAFALAILSPSTIGFAPVTPHTTRGNSFSSSLLPAINEKSRSDDVATTRRGFMDNIVSASVAIAGVSSVWMAPSPALAYGLKKANEKLAR